MKQLNDIVAVAKLAGRLEREIHGVLDKFDGYEVIKYVTKESASLNVVADGDYITSTAIEDVQAIVRPFTVSYGINVFYGITSYDGKPCLRVSILKG